MTDYFLALSDHYKAVRARLNAGPPSPWRQPVLPVLPPPPPEPELELSAPVWTVPDHPPTAKQIARDALRPFKLTLDEAMKPSRQIRYIRARAAVYGALREHGWSLKKIAIFCNRDHTTILNSLQKFPYQERDRWTPKAS
jgi:hypothetical protein